MQATMHNRLRGWGVTVLRVVSGLIFLAHGAQKLFGVGLGGVAGTMEGFGIPAPALAAVPLAVSMLVATLLVHLPNGLFAQEGGVEYTLLLTVACVALAMTGPGEAALDRVLARRGTPLTAEESYHPKVSP